MKLNTLAATALLTLAPLAAAAETIEVRMLNRGEAGAMVFEPRYVEAEVGDTIKFVATDRGHNAETVDGMVPEGQEDFKGRVNEEIEVVLTTAGVIGVKCAPHFGMGMVMVIEVGDADVPEDFLEARMPRPAKGAFEDILAEAATE